MVWEDVVIELKALGRGDMAIWVQDQVVGMEPVLFIDPGNYEEAMKVDYGALRYLTRSPQKGDIPLCVAPKVLTGDKHGT